MTGRVLRSFGVGLVGSLLVLLACSSSGSQGGGDTTSSDPTRAPEPNVTEDEVISSKGPDGGVDAAPDVASTEPDTRVDGGPPEIRFIGRFDTRGAGPKCGWAGCRILARFEGTSVSVVLEELVQSWMAGAPSEWDVSIDGSITEKLVMIPGTNTYTLAAGLPPGVHEVELYKRSEAQNGVTRFLSFDFGEGTLLEPPPRSSRRIEIVGDSSAAGFGVEGVGYPNNDCPGLDESAMWQNFRKSFGALLGETFDAEVFGTVYSGKGMVKNIWRPDTQTMPVVFLRAEPTDMASTYDFAWQPDVVIVMIGGNDFDEGKPDEEGGRGPASPEQFTDAYRAFVGLLREKYPSAHIFLSVSPSLTNAYPPGRNIRTNVTNATTSIALERISAGDMQVHAFSPTVAPAYELTACNGHGTPAFHTRVASEFAAQVSQKLGW